MKRLIYVMLATFFVCLSVCFTTSALAVEIDTNIPSEIFPLPDTTVTGNIYQDYFLYKTSTGDIKLFYFYLAEGASSNTNIDGFLTSTGLVIASTNHQLKYKSYNFTNGAWDNPTMTAVNKTYTYSGYPFPCGFGSSIIIMDSSVDIRNGIDKSSGNFFPQPPTELYQMVQAVTKEEMKKTQISLVGVMKILTLCGVGLIALLMVLPLFGKVLRIFRVK